MYEYKNKNLPINERVENLLSLMSLDEKIEQINYMGGKLSLDEHIENAKKGINSLKCGIYSFKYFDLQKLNYLQHFAVEKTRLGIPLFIASEGTHGLTDARATVFPTAAGIAATFDTDIAYEVARVTAEEAKALGFNQIYGPNLDLLRDARFGRCEESMGEDPYLISEMGKQMVRAYKENNMSSVLKHFICFGSVESGLNCSSVTMGEREIREYMLPPFEECIKAGADGVMGTYSDIDGIPAHANKRLMVDILRDELKFDGVVITDYGAAALMRDVQRITDSSQTLAQKMLECNIDIECCGATAYSDALKQALSSGKVTMEQVDRAVRRILTIKFSIGLFDNPYFDPNLIDGEIFTKENRQLCRKVSEEGCVLLKNDGILPLKKDTKIALVGPNSDIVQMGSYCFYPCLIENCEIDSAYNHAFSLKTALENAFGKENVQTERGCGFGLFLENSKRKAMEICKESDVVIFAGGNNSIANYGGDEGTDEQAGGKMSNDAVTSGGGGYDNHDLGLTKPQKDLLKEIKKLNKKVVFIVYGGKPLSLEDEIDDINGLLYAFGVGTDGNLAVADILLGKVNPSGKLPYSIPRTAGHIPCYYNHKPVGKGYMFNSPGSYEKFGMDYVFSSPFPRFKFGDGLSYTKFEYSNMNCKEVDDGWELSFELSNVGDYDGTETVLVYTTNPPQEFVSPIVKKLRKFKRVNLLKGEKKTIKFLLTTDDFSYVNADMKKSLAIGEGKIICADKECIINVTAK